MRRVEVTNRLRRMVLTERESPSQKVFPIDKYPSNLTTLTTQLLRKISELSRILNGLTLRNWKSLGVFGFWRFIQ